MVSAKSSCKFTVPLSLVTFESNQIDNSYVTTTSMFKEAVKDFKNREKFKDLWIY